MERQRQLLGCSEQAQSCMSELADAIGARFVLSGSLSRLGDAYQLSLQTMDTQKTQPLGRSVRISRDVGALNAQIAYAVAEATATPLPPPPSRVLPFTLIAAGAAFAVAGAVVGMDGISRDRAIGAELKASDTNPGVLRPLSSYQSDATLVTVEKSIGLAAVGVGVGLAMVGLFLLPSSSAEGPQVTLAPTTNGVVLVGVFP